MPGDLTSTLTPQTYGDTPTLPLTDVRRHDPKLQQELERVLGQQASRDAHRGGEGGSAHALRLGWQGAWGATLKRVLGQ